MTIFEALILGIIQGITEFLPISSSGHLILVENALGLHIESLKSFDIALHLGTLFAILIYFKNDFLNLGKNALQGKFEHIGWLVLATLPAVIVGAYYRDSIDTLFRNPMSVAIVLFVFSLVFIIAEKYPRTKNIPLIQPEKTRLGNAKRILFIGVMQALALIPGISRSGATISAGLMLGVERARSARFSFLLGAIAISGASVIGFKDLLSDTTTYFELPIFTVGILSSAIAGYITIKFLMKFLTHHTLIPFAYYRMGIAVLYMIFALFIAQPSI